MDAPRDAVVVGAGIVGLATAYALVRRGVGVTVLDKEDRPAVHQSGHNSGVVHSGLYYAPGSLKATLGVAGAASMLRFAREHDVAVDQCGKLVVATRSAQLPALAALHRRGRANGVPCRLVDPAEARRHEPEVSCVAALHVASTGRVDYPAVARALAQEVTTAGGTLRFGTTVRGVRARGSGVVLDTTTGDVAAGALVNCAGLYADRLARLAGVDPGVRIVPFRGEYVSLAPAYTELVRGLIYPVPDPSLPFLGVHLTRGIDGRVHAGPNAVLALAREGYGWGSVVPRDVWDAVTWPGLWRLGRRHWRTGAAEVARSLSPRRFAASLRELVPAIPDEALRPAPAGVRAQAMRRDGSLVEDFLVVRGPRQVHVVNAPSPAATASLEIGRRIAEDLLSSG